jgi:(2Fe-2S) ferredoxin
MAAENNSPYICHVFVCVNDRQGKRKSCADGWSPQVRMALKQAVNDRGWKGRVRVSQCGCMGLCADGPNIILYPQQVWYAGVTMSDVDSILSRVEAFLSDSA